MYTAAALLDVHERTHRSLHQLMEHCRKLDDEELHRALDGFGYATVQLQLVHVVGAEEYWIGVVRGLMLAEDNDDVYRTIDQLQEYRARVAEATAGWLRGASASELNTRRTMTTFGGRQQELVPAHVVLRTQTHVFQHQGQVAAMCRLLGEPVSPGLDFPLA